MAFVQRQRGKYFINHQSGPGFTLVELMVAIAIFTSLLSFVVIKYRDDEKVRVLKNQVQSVVSGLEQVQNMALTGESIDSQTPLSYQFSVTDCAENCAYELSATLADGTSLPIAENILNAVGVSMVSVPGGLTVKYAPPRGKMSILSSLNAADTFDSASFEISNGEALVYCIRLDAVSGRVDSKSGTCQ